MKLPLHGVVRYTMVGRRQVGDGGGVEGVARQSDFRGRPMWAVKNSRIAMSAVTATMALAVLAACGSGKMKRDLVAT